MTSGASDPGMDSLIERALVSQRVKRYAVRPDFADQVARSLSVAPRARRSAGMPAILLVVVSVLTVSTAVAGIVRFLDHDVPVEPVYCAECAVEVQHMAPVPTQPAVKAPSATAPRPRAQTQTLTLTREIRIDGTTEDLIAIGWVRVARDGRVAFSQSRDGLVRFYDPNGKLIGKFGRTGDGPGEFRMLSQAGWFGDSLWVHDGNNGRITVIPPTLSGERIFDSGFSRFMRGTDSRNPLITIANLEGITSAGEMIISGLFTSDSPLPLAQSQWVGLERGFVRAPTSAGYQDFLGGMAQVTNARVSVDGATVTVPFIARNISMAMHDGSRFAIVQPAVEGRDAGTFLVTAIGARGDTIFTRRHPVSLERVAALEAQKAINERIATLVKMGKSNAESFRTLAKVPRSYPPFGLSLMGRDGSIWLQMRGIAAGRPWLALDPFGNVHGQVVLKDGVRIAEADLTSIWAVEPDANGIHSLVRYRVTSRR